MNWPEHSFVGSIIGIIFGAWLIISGHSTIALLCFLFCIWGSLLPDFIDPPGNPFHRSIGHNYISLILFTILGLISLGLAIIVEWWFFIFWTGFFFSVLSHLLLDLTTPMGLPMFTGKSILGLIEIPLLLIPWINVLVILIMLIMSYKSIKFLAKKIGGVKAMLLAFIPLWSTPLVLAIGAKQLSWLGIIGDILGEIMRAIFIIIIIIIIILGIGMNKRNEAKNRKVKKKEKDRKTKRSLNKISKK